MTGSFFQTIPDVMVGVAGDCDRTATEFDTQFHALQTYCENLSGGGQWLGPASAKFNELMKAWDAHAKNLNTALRGLAQGLNANARDYVDGETLNEQEINKVYTTLPPANLLQAMTPNLNLG